MLSTGEILLPVATAVDPTLEAQLAALARSGGRRVAVLVRQSPHRPNAHLAVLYAVLTRLTAAGIDVVDTHSARGNWADAILRYAHARNPQLIFMAAEDRSETDRKLPSTTAHTVAHHA